MCKTAIPWADFGARYRTGWTPRNIAVKMQKAVTAHMKWSSYCCLPQSISTWSTCTQTYLYGLTALISSSSCNTVHTRSIYTFMIVNPPKGVYTLHMRRGTAVKQYLVIKEEGQAWQACAKPLVGVLDQKMSIFSYNSCYWQVKPQ